MFTSNIYRDDQRCRYLVDQEDFRNTFCMCRHLTLLKGLTLISASSCTPSASTLAFIHPVGKNNKQRVIEAIIDMGEMVTPKEIIEYMSNLERKKIEQNHPDYSNKHKDNLARKNAMKERTVKRWLRILNNEGIAIKKGGRYSIHDKIKSDYRYFGQRFGRGALHLLMKAHWGGTYTLQENTEALINIFGIYVLFCFAEASKSFKIADQAEDTTDNIDKRISSWVLDVLDPSNMFAYFLSIMKYQPDNKEVMRYRRSGLDDRHLTSGAKKRKGSYLPFIEDGVIKPILQDEKETKYTIDETIINRMIEIISEKYPKYYEPLNNARERVLFEIKHGYLNQRS